MEDRHTTFFSLPFGVTPSPLFSSFPDRGNREAAPSVPPAQANPLFSPALEARTSPLRGFFSVPFPFLTSLIERNSPSFPSANGCGSPFLPFFFPRRRQNSPFRHSASPFSSPFAGQGDPCASLFPFFHSIQIKASVLVRYSFPLFPPSIRNAPGGVLSPLRVAGLVSFFLFSLLSRSNCQKDVPSPLRSDAEASSSFFGCIGAGSLFPAS